MLYPSQQEGKTEQHVSGRRSKDIEMCNDDDDDDDDGGTRINEFLVDRGSHISTVMVRTVHHAHLKLSL